VPAAVPAEIAVRDTLRADEVAAVATLLEAVRAADHREPLAEHKLLDLSHGGDGRPGFAAFLHRTAEGWVDGYAQLSPGGQDAAGLGVVVHPARRGAAGNGADLEAAMVQTAVRRVAGRGGGRIRYWQSAPGPERVALAARLGFAPDRELLQLGADLPLAPSAVPAPPGLRAFAPGSDEAQWLEVNNRAFAAHPEQGGWDLAQLEAREAEPWFDPAGFLVAEEGGRLLGSCWTKIHPGDPPVGEIYVISVDPARHHRGLGRSLAVAGLGAMADRGLTRAMLYVDRDNEPAVALYQSLGFTVDHVDRAYLLDVPAAPLP
jgi:mycothiol synthase